MKKKRNAGSEHCSNLIPIGEGDHVCYECGEPVMPVSDYIPTDDYLKCGGRKYERKLSSRGLVISGGKGEMTNPEVTEMFKIDAGKDC